jgi:hypothetical protein
MIRNDATNLRTTAGHDPIMWQIKTKLRPHRLYRQPIKLQTRRQTEPQLIIRRQMQRPRHECAYKKPCGNVWKRNRSSSRRPRKAKSREILKPWIRKQRRLRIQAMRQPCLVPRLLFPRVHQLAPCPPANKNRTLLRLLHPRRALHLLQLQYQFR